MTQRPRTLPSAVLAASLAVLLAWAGAAPQAFAARGSVLDAPSSVTFDLASEVLPSTSAPGRAHEAGGTTPPPARSADAPMRAAWSRSFGGVGPAAPLWRARLSPLAVGHPANAPPVTA